MSIEFTFVPVAFSASGSQAVPFYFDPRRASGVLADLDGVGMTGAVIDDLGGALANIDLADRVAPGSGALALHVTHWAGVLAPLAAAEQIAALDARTGGRVVLRIAGAHTAGDRPSHVDLWRQADEYLSLLKRLWCNDRPIDHEGAHYSLRAAFVADKGLRGCGIPIRVAGSSGTAIEVAGRHADVFELPGEAPDTVAALIGRVRSAAAMRGRRGRVRFALPLRLNAQAGSSFASLSAEVGAALLAYARVGVGEFMLAGTNDTEVLSTFVRQARLLLRLGPVGVVPETHPQRSAIRSRAARWAN